ASTTILPIFNPSARINERSPSAVGCAARVAGIAAMDFLLEARFAALSAFIPLEALVDVVLAVAVSVVLSRGATFSTIGADVGLLVAFCSAEFWPSDATSFEVRSVSSLDSLP